MELDLGEGAMLDAIEETINALNQKLGAERERFIDQRRVNEEREAIFIRELSEARKHFSAVVRASATAHGLTVEGQRWNYDPIAKDFTRSV